MRTRTLLLLAVGCGLAILLAGGIRLLSVSTSSSSDHRIGESARAGDLVVTVVALHESAGRAEVAIRWSGVDDPDARAGLHLVVPGAALSPLADGVVGSCAAVTVAEQSCTLAFDTHAVQGTTRVLLLRRGEDQVRWTLA
jgi:hypothetical protein